MSEVSGESLSAPSSDLLAEFKQLSESHPYRNTGRVALTGNSLVEVIIDEYGTCFSHGIPTWSENGRGLIIWTDITLDSDGSLHKHIETEIPPEIDDIETPMSAETVGQLVVDQLCGLAGRDGAMMMLVDKLNADNEADQLGLTAVSALELQESIEILRSDCE